MEESGVPGRSRDRREFLGTDDQGEEEDEDDVEGEAKESFVLVLRSLIPSSLLFRLIFEGLIIVTLLCVSLLTASRALAGSLMGCPGVTRRVFPFIFLSNATFLLVLLLSLSHVWRSSRVSHEAQGTKGECCVEPRGLQSEKTEDRGQRRREGGAEKEREGRRTGVLNLSAIEERLSQSEQMYSMYSDGSAGDAEDEEEDGETKRGFEEGDGVVAEVEKDRSLLRVPERKSGESREPSGESEPPPSDEEEDEEEIGDATPAFEEEEEEDKEEERASRFGIEEYEDASVALVEMGGVACNDLARE